MIAENRQSQIENSQFRVLPLQAEERDILRPRARPALIDWLSNNYMLAGGTAAIEGYWNRKNSK